MNFKKDAAQSLDTDKEWEGNRADVLTALIFDCIDTAQKKGLTDSEIVSAMMGSAFALAKKTSPEVMCHFWKVVGLLRSK